MPDTPLCVYCRRRPVEDPYRPFCSERCKMADLGRWLSDDYRVPIRQDADTDLKDASTSEDSEPS
jgi:endogenous inhibitor of DNA gyrase (YacG/DUF329 family)